METDVKTRPSIECINCKQQQIFSIRYARYIDQQKCEKCGSPMRFIKHLNKILKSRKSA